MLVAVIGASPNPSRYSNKAIKMLQAHGHSVVPVNPKCDQIEGLSVVADPSHLPPGIHTITIYVGPQHIEPLIDAIISAKPNRIIANPGAESSRLRDRALDAGIQYIEGCTLVLLSTGQF